MRLKIDPMKCVRCGLCEVACSLNRDSVLTPMTSSIMLHIDDKANYFGLVLKAGGSCLVLARPEGTSTGQGSGGSGGPGAKPILLREACDFCEGSPRCALICPTLCITVVD